MWNAIVVSLFYIVPNCCCWWCCEKGGLIVLLFCLFLWKSVGVLVKKRLQDILQRKQINVFKIYKTSNKCFCVCFVLLVIIFFSGLIETF